MRSRRAFDFCANPLNGRLHIALDQARLEPKDAIPSAAKRSIPAGVCVRAPGVPSSIDLDDHAWLGYQEINHEPPDGDLTAYLESEAAIANGLPQQTLRFCRSRPKQLGATGEQLRAAW
jgi:hypothetical protein